MKSISYDINLKIISTHKDEYQCVNSNNDSRVKEKEEEGGVHLIFL